MSSYTLNRQNLKNCLLRLKNSSHDFTIVYSGKASKRVDGLYKSESREIILHTKNFKSDNELLYTAIHEFAHHIQFTESAVPVSTRSHTTEFWHQFHTLLFKAEELGLYTSPFESNREFASLTKRIKEEILKVNGNLMKTLGRLLLEAQSLCEKFHASFGDYLDRVLCLPRTSASTIIKSHLYDLRPEIGFENMRTLTRIGNEEVRRQAQEAILDGQSQEMVKVRFVNPPKKLTPLDTLLAEKQRIQRTIRTLTARLEELERRIEEYSAESFK
jgi:hypothetical protein